MIDYGDILTDADYLQIVNDLAEVFEPDDMLNALYKRFINSNPSYLDKLLAVSQQEAISDCAQMYFDKKLTTPDFEEIRKALIDRTVLNADISVIENMFNDLEQKYFICDLSEYVNLYFQILKFNFFINENGTLGSDVSYLGLSAVEKLFILRALIISNGLTKNELEAGGEVISRHLGVLLGLHHTTIEDAFKKLKKYLDFKNMEYPAASKAFKRYKKISHLLKQNDTRSNNKLLNSYLTNIEISYKNKFGESED